MRKLLQILTAGMIICGTVGMICNLRVKTKQYKLSYPNLPDSFDGFKIVQISDIHNAEFGHNNSKITARVVGCNPDIIVLTGDIVSDNLNKYDNRLVFIGSLCEIAPVYYVTGNHEGLDRYMSLDEQGNTLLDKFLNDIRALGVTVLRNQDDYIERNGQKIHLIGLDDPYTHTDIVGGYKEYCEINKSLKGYSLDTFDIVLCHRPNWFYDQSQKDIELVLTGHTHAGQLRIPVIGALYLPDEKWLPELRNKLSYGMYKNYNSICIVNGGLGTSRIDFRFGIIPEINMIILNKEM